MINRIIRFSVEHSGLTLAFTCLLVLGGWISFRQLPIDAVPDVTNVQVQVNTAVKGLVPEEIERFITYPVESAMGGLPAVEEVRSISRFGLSQVTIVFEEGTDIYWARQLVSEKLQSVRENLPPGLDPELGPISTGLGEIFFYSLDVKEPAEGDARVRQLMELRTIQEWTIKPRLLKLSGVAEVNTIGGFEKQYHVHPKLEEMAKYGIHIESIVEALEVNNRNAGGGYIQQTAEQFLVQGKGLISSIEDIENIPVKRLPLFKTITIGDIAEVSLGKELRTGAATVDGRETIMGTILMLAGENSRATANEVESSLSQIQKSLPDHVELKTLYNRSDLVDQTLFTVRENLTYGALLVVVVLMILVGNIRVAAITAITIPLAMLGTFVFMKVFKVSGNLMSLGALDFGIIIDGAVIVIDNCVRVIQQRCQALGRPLLRGEIKQAVTDGTIEIRRAAGFGQLIIVIVFLPIFALEGVEGKMFVPMALTFCFALTTGFILSFSVVPALAGLILPGNLSAKPPWVMAKLQQGYEILLKGVLRVRLLIVATLLGAVGLGGYLLSTSGSEFLPQLDEGSIAIQFVRPTDISVEQAVAMQKISEKALLEFPEVARVIARMGTAEIATDPMGINLSDTYVLLKSGDLWPAINGKPRTKVELIQAIKETFEQEIPGQRLIFSQPIQLRFNELLEGVRADVALKVYGPDTAELDRLAQQASSILRTIPGAGDVEEEIKGTSPLLRIEPKTSALMHFGIPKEEVISTVETAVGGTQAGFFYDGVVRFPIYVRLKEQDRNSLASLEQLPVGAAENLTTPLKDLATMEFVETYSDIRREASQKRTAVLINIRGRDTQSFVLEAQELISEQLMLPPGYYVEWGGSFKNLSQARERLMYLVPLALFLVLAMVYTAFKNSLQTILIFTSLPMALLGGVIGLKLNGLDFSISAAIGFIALSGIAVLNGVVLMSYLNQLRAAGMSGKELILEGSRMRLRPILMTALTDALGFLPMMLSTGMGAEVQRPLAAVVVGGILTASFLTLICLPVLYSLVEPWLDSAVESP
ncbi:efflux RND transporter permease subunit [Pseudobacteriovorax antillogorgiicola]|uniref:Cobalt-zinc-cadmium resistance protein CzcA n=1 Tax=Pseudobacteriovorax antillogorgiicola TaxID=1513793 RepID=A0A1Y6C781_9BACT|nr:CusA/CzcA family heavy metal efflux RND transporter [Pseudobacteriovorax antillogorgiicola]TCS50651.1 cobalt-zinc-cadmium resistance protein CzcA [Pseudobacteriovorax antillogorgiicola]SMF39708.1 cobalt-zinc-cadmium resistance protein CzcA [Pseudobacteriovorax antillogorgiicola]